MARIRGLKPDFFKDEDLACLPFEARLLFEGLWCLADREGRLEDRPRYIKAEIFPYDKVDIEKLLNLLAEPQIQGRPNKVFIRRYRAGDRQYIEIPEFLRHQSPHHTEKKSVIPPYNGPLTVNSPLRDGESQEDTDHCFMDQIHGSEKGAPRGAPSSSRTTRLTDDEFIRKLKDNPAYAHIDLDCELAKMDAWFLTPKGHGRMKTRRFVLNWLNKIDGPLNTGPPPGQASKERREREIAERKARLLTEERGNSP